MEIVCVHGLILCLTHLAHGRISCTRREYTKPPTILSAHPKPTVLHISLNLSCSYAHAHKLHKFIPEVGFPQNSHADKGSVELQLYPCAPQQHNMRCVVHTVILLSLRPVPFLNHCVCELEKKET